MPSGLSRFNACDPYDAAALFDMWFNCQGCPATFDFEPDLPIGLDYYHLIGQRAKAGQWAVRERADPGDAAGVCYLVLCPVCAARQGLDSQAPWRQAPAKAIEEICQAMQAAQGNVAA